MRVAPEKSPRQARSGRWVSTNGLFWPGARLLLVSDDECLVLGLIASNDVLGEKPVQLGPQRGVKRQEIRVRDIMIPSERLDVLHYADFVHAGVAHTFAEIGAALTR